MSARRRLDIVRVMPFFAARFGGCVAQARAVSAQLAAAGHRVRVVTTDNGVEPAVPRDRWVERDGYEVFHARSKPIHRVVPYYTPVLRAPLAAALEDADVLQMNVGLTLTNALARRVARARRVPYVYNAEGALCPRRLRIKRGRKWVFLRAVERRVLRDAAALQVVTEKEGRDLERLGAPHERIVRIPNGVATSGPRTERRAERTRPSILFLGRIHPVKGLDLLVGGLARAKHEAYLVVAGPDEAGHRAVIAARARALGLESRVRFTGMLDDQGRRDAFASADAFALTSYSEGLPNAVLEACAAGLPVLVTEGCNLPEVAEFGAGRVCEANAGAVAAGLDALLGGDLAAIGRAARRMVEERFALATVTRQLEELYAGIARA